MTANRLVGVLAVVVSVGWAAVAGAQPGEVHRLGAPITPGALVATPGSPAQVSAPAVSPEPASAAEGDEDSASATLLDRSGKRVGLVTFDAMGDGTLVNAEFTGLPPGAHGFHIHAVGKCEPPFESAGPHFNPSGAHHGFVGGPGHAGDLPNLFVPESGKLTIEVFAPGITVGDGPRSLFDGDGSAVVVHAERDDYKTDPAGKAGDRIACGVIER